MQLTTLPVSDIVPAPYNPRIAIEPGSHEHRRLSRSLDEFDLVQPMVWNRLTGHLVSGHQRLSILIERGVTEVPAVVVDLPIEREKALNVTLNNRAVGSDWDAEKLIDLVTELDAAPDFDATLTGFDEDVLNDLMFVPDPEPKVDEETVSDRVEVSLTVDMRTWSEFCGRLDTALRGLPIECHIRLPPGA